MLKGDYTLTLSDTSSHNLLTLLIAADANFVDMPASQVTLQADNGNTTKNIFVGTTSTVSATAFGQQLSAGASTNFSGREKIITGGIWVIADVSGPKLHYYRTLP